MKHPVHGEGLRAYERLLATDGAERGLIGPRETGRLWERHILNCAVVVAPGGPVPEGATVVDVGSGAGLPGLVWAIERPDLRVVLIESLLRRSAFLTEAIESLELTERVTVRRARAEEVTDLKGDVVTARAVAPLSRLIPWLRPLMARGGQLLAFKGENAQDDVDAAHEVAARAGLTPAEILRLGVGIIDPPTTVVRYVGAGA